LSTPAGRYSARHAHGRHPVWRRFDRAAQHRGWLSIARGSPADFNGITLIASEKAATPFSVKVRITNVGAGNVTAANNDPGNFQFAGPVEMKHATRGLNVCARGDSGVDELGLGPLTYACQ
jgi:hypothetical protein